MTPHTDTLLEAFHRYYYSLAFPLMCSQTYGQLVTLECLLWLHCTAVYLKSHRDEPLLFKASRVVVRQPLKPAEGIQCLARLGSSVTHRSKGHTSVSLVTSVAGLQEQACSYQSRSLLSHDCLVFDGRPIYGTTTSVCPSRSRCLTDWNAEQGLNLKRSLKFGRTQMPSVMIVWYYIEKLA